MNTDALKKIRSLTMDAKSLANFHDDFATRFADKKHYDKQGYGFVHGAREAAFGTEVGFNSWYGEYGSSSAYSVLSVQDREAVKAAFIKALNKNQKLIFATMAAIMRAEAASMTEAAQREIASLNQMLSEIETIDPPKMAAE